MNADKLSLRSWGKGNANVDNRIVEVWVLELRASLNV